MRVNRNAATVLSKIILEESAGDVLMQNMPLICELIPEINDSIGFVQNNPHHHLNVWEHTIKAVENTPSDIILRLTMLLHDIAKPRCYTEDNRGGHFYGHPQVSSDMAKEILLRLGYDDITIEIVTQLVLYHDSEIHPRRKHLKRWLNKIGEERLRQLIEVKKADAKSQAEEYRKSKLSKSDAVLTIIDDIVEEQKRFSLKDLAVNGRDLIDNGVPQSVEIGNILNRLMGMVMDGHVDNEKEKLLSAVPTLFNE